MRSFPLIKSVKVLHAHANNSLLQEMYSIVQDVTTSLTNEVVACSDIYLLKVLVLLMIIFKCNQLFSFTLDVKNRVLIQHLLRKLAIKDDKSCQVVNTKLFATYETALEKTLNTFITNAVSKFVPPITEWIFAVPLLHFMKRKCAPFEQLDMTSWDSMDDHCTIRQVCSSVI